MTPTNELNRLLCSFYPMIDDNTLNAFLNRRVERTEVDGFIQQLVQIINNLIERNYALNVIEVCLSLFKHVSYNSTNVHSFEYEYGIRRNFIQTGNTVNTLLDLCFLSKSVDVVLQEQI